MNSLQQKERLRSALHNVPTGQPGRDFLQAVGQEARTHRPRIGFCTFLGMQVKFMGWKIWLFQGGLLALMLAVIHGFCGSHFWRYPSGINGLVCVLSFLVSATALPIVIRSRQYRMQEVEAASRMASARLLLAKLLLVGAGDLAMLLGILLTAVVKATLDVGSVSLYLLFPFLLASTGLLFLMARLDVRYLLPGSVGMYAVLMGSVLILRQLWPAFSAQRFSLGWGLVCVGLLGLCAVEIRQILENSHFAEMQLC